MSGWDFEDDLRRLGEAAEPDIEQLERLERRTDEALAADRPRRRRLGWLAVGVALGAAVVAATAVPGLQPTERPLALAGTARLGPAVRARGSGHGTVIAEPASTEVTWTEGPLTLEVDPLAGHAVSVRTDEALVRVTGTRFTVERNRLGTEVRVEEGSVTVHCHVEPTPLPPVTAGGQALCLRDAGSGLGRLLLLERQISDPRSRLYVIERALAHPVGLEATRHLLADRRVEVLVELGRTEAALAQARALPEPYRRPRLTQQANEAMTRRGCDDANPWLEALAEAHDVSGTLLRIQCLADEDPEGARALLHALPREGLTVDQASALRAWQRTLRK